MNNDWTFAIGMMFVVMMLLLALHLEQGAYIYNLQERLGTLEVEVTTLKARGIRPPFRPAEVLPCQ
jgi:hypothetical protein